MEGARRAAKHTQCRKGVVEGARRAAKRTQSREECRRVGGQPNILRAARSVGEQEGSQTHSEPPSTLRARGRGGWEREGSQAYSELGEWWREREVS